MEDELTVAVPMLVQLAPLSIDLYTVKILPLPLPRCVNDKDVGLLIAGVIAYPLVFMASLVLPLSVLPNVPLSFHTPEDSVADVSLEGAEVGKPLSKFSVTVV